MTAPLLLAVAIVSTLLLEQLAAQPQFNSPSPRQDAPPDLAPRPTFNDAVRGLFFRDVRAHLGHDEPVAEPPLSEPTEPAPSPSAPETAPNPWSQVVTREVLEDEIKTQVPVLAEALASPSKFKAGGHRQARDAFSLLAVLFGVIAQYDGEVRWRDQAAAMRDALAHAAQNCKVGTDASFKEARLRSEDLAELVRGGTPVLDEAPAEPEGGWAKVSDRAPLMARLETAQRGRLDVWTANRREFEKQRQALDREARLLALMAVIIQDPGFDYGDDQQYQDYAGELATRARELIEALRQADQSAAQSAVSRTNQTCDRCHTDYRG